MALTETVRSVLKTKGSMVWSVDPDATVFEALLLLAEHDVGALVVLSGGDLVGIFSERDYARKVILQGKSSKETLVREIMSGDVVTVTLAHTVDECLWIMTSHRIRHLPVLDGGRLAGVVSIGDLVNSIISAQKETIQQLSSYIAGQYPG